MSPAQSFITRRPVLTYFALAFGISWGGGLFVLGPSRIPTTVELLMTIGPIMYVAMLAGPSVAGLLMTSLVSGRAGLRELLARLTAWRVGRGWYAVALLAPPLMVISVSLALSFFSSDFLPAIFVTSEEPAVLSGVIAGLIVGIFEEVGWTGFAIPRIRRRYGVFSTGLLVGVLWGAWHFPMFWEPNSFSGALPFGVLLVRLFSWLPAFRILMVWVYDRTGSLFVAMLMHGSLTAAQLIFMPPPSSSGMTLVISILAWAAALWIVVALIAVGGRWQLSRPLRKQMA